MTITRNDTQNRHRSSTASVRQHHELARPAAAFLPIFCCQPGSDLWCGGEKSDDMNAGVLFQKVDCLACSVSRNSALLEDKELSTDLTHDKQ